MATEFNTQTGGGKYRLQFETDNEEYFLLMQELARCCVDHPPIKTNADRIRAMSDEELVDFMSEFNVCDTRSNMECKFLFLANCRACALNWLQQPAEVNND